VPIVVKINFRILEKKLLQRKEEKLSVMGRKIMGKEEHSK